MSIEKSQSRDNSSTASGVETLATLETTTPSIPTTSMVLSTIPLDGGHVVIRQTNGSPPQMTAASLQSQQQHQQQQQQQHHLINSNVTNCYPTTSNPQIHRNSPAAAIITTSSSSTKSTYITNGNGSSNGTTNGNAIANSMPTQSKFVFLQPNGNGQYTTNEVVLVSTEPMEMGSGEQVISVNEAGTVCDEELTSLTWLHDKNLLKDIVTCTKNNRKAIVQRMQAQTNGGPTMSIVGGQISPTSDYVEDCSGNSEENGASNSEQGINEYAAHQSHIHYSNNNNNNNNHNLVKNRNNHQILSPNGVNYIGTNQASLHEQVNGSLSTIGATTTVHVGPSGTTTVVEYKTNSNFAPSRLSGGNGVTNGGTGGTTITPAANNYVPSSPQRNVVLTNVASPQQQQQQQQQLNSSNSNSNSTLSTTHHPHKKYLREKMNALDQSGGGGTNNSGGGNVIVNASQKTILAASPFSSGSSTSSTASSPASSVANYANNIVGGHTLQGIPTLSPEPAREYQPQNFHVHSVMKSPASYSTNSYENDSLKDFELTSVPVTNGRISTSINAQQQQQQQHSQSQQHAPLPLQKTSPTPPKQKHPTNVPYDPLVHTNNKPPYSFSSLIFMAIEGSTEKALPVKEIYAWIVQHFPYFKTAPTGWKNSVRHNLSLNKSFVKVEKAPNMGKGSLWRVEQQQRQNLIQALSRSPCFPNSTVDKISQKSPVGNGNSMIASNSCNNSPVSTESDGSPPMTPGKSNLDATLFPKISKAIKHFKTNDQDDDSPSEYSAAKFGNGYYMNDTSTPIGSYENIERMARDCGADSIDDVNAATAMLALKHGPKVFNETFQNGSPVITSSPSEDHTYSAGGVGGGGGGAVVGNGSCSNGTTISVINNSNCNGNMAVNGNGDKPIVPTNGFSVDNQSNCASSDAAYESSEESHNISPEELEDQQRHRDGVYALLSLSSSHVDISPIKRPPSTTVEQEHISSYMENIPHLNGKSNSYNTSSSSSSTTTNGSSNSTGHLDEGYNTQSYYSQMVSPSPPKKQKPGRNLRAKTRRKTTFIR